MINNYLGTHDPSEVVLLLAGYQVTGFAEGTGIAISRSEGVVGKTVGINGATSLHKIRDTTGTLTITLQKTSEDNAWIEAWQRATSVAGVPAVIPLLMEDPTGSSMVSALAWLETQADFSVEQETSSREWVFGVLDATMSPNLAAAGAIAAADLAVGSGII